MQIRQGAAIAFSGLVWMSVGILLLFKGFSLLLVPQQIHTGLLVPFFLGKVRNADQVSLCLVSLGLLIGFIKGKWVLAKTARRVIQRIVSLPNPVSVRDIYSRSYLVLLSSMILLGFSLKWIAIPYDVKGIIDVAIGSALANGSAFYFRYFAEKKGRV